MSYSLFICEESHKVKVWLILELFSDANALKKKLWSHKNLRQLGLGGGIYTLQHRLLVRKLTDEQRGGFVGMSHLDTSRNSF